MPATGPTLTGIETFDARDRFHQALDVTEPRVDLAKRLEDRQVFGVLRQRRLEHLGAVSKLSLVAVTQAVAGWHSVLPPG